MYHLPFGFSMDFFGRKFNKYFLCFLFKFKGKRKSRMTLNRKHFQQVFSIFFFHMLPDGRQNMILCVPRTHA